MAGPDGAVWPDKRYFQLSAATATVSPLSNAYYNSPFDQGVDLAENKKGKPLNRTRVRRFAYKRQVAARRTAFRVNSAFQSMLSLADSLPAFKPNTSKKVCQC
jgi:hypothetical protein